MMLNAKEYQYQKEIILKDNMQASLHKSSLIRKYTVTQKADYKQQHEIERHTSVRFVVKRFDEYGSIVTKQPSNPVNSITQSHCLSNSVAFVAESMITL